MKQALTVLSIAVALAACNQDAKTKIDAATISPAHQQSAVPADTAGLAEFRQWKIQQQAGANAKEYQQAVYYAAAPVKKARKTYAAPVYEPEPVYPSSGTSASGSGTNTTGNESGSMNSESSNAAKAPVKKGWSKAAKGTAIGAGAGAVAGAVINKRNRVVGGVVGGVLGGAVGYGIGRHIDKKDGRY